MGCFVRAFTAGVVIVFKDNDVTTGERLFVWSVPARAKVTAIPQCLALWTAAEKKARALTKKSQDNFDAAEKLQSEADAAMRRCYNERAKSQTFFQPLVKQAQELVDRVK